MKFSEQWLRHYVNPDWSTEALADALTMAGLEVESIDPVAPLFNRVVVGGIESIEQHPNADRLRICQVNIASGELVQIVCGASNAAAGIKVACALPGRFSPVAWRSSQSRCAVCRVPACCVLQRSSVFRRIMKA